MEIQNPKSKIQNRKVRVGIDVGGTFTDVVVVDNDTREVVSQLKVPTTHSAREGVALGIINAIERALSELEISPDDVIFIAHSTTQATNALLEGDVAQVGVIGLGSGSKAGKQKSTRAFRRLNLRRIVFCAPNIDLFQIEILKIEI
jgi:N-methylhydantoinase A